MKQIPPIKSQMAGGCYWLYDFFQKCGKMLKFLRLLESIFLRRAVKIIVEVFRQIPKKLLETRVDFRGNICPMKMGPSH